MKRRFLVPLCGVALLITRALGQEPEQSIPSVIVVPTLDTEVQPGNVVTWSAAMPSMWRELCDHFGADKIVLTPESKLANELNTWKQDPAVILPKDGYLVLSGDITKNSVQAARYKVKQKFNEIWPELDALLTSQTELNWFAFCKLVQNLRFEPAFVPENSRAMLFKDGLEEEHKVKYFGSPPDQADKFSGVVQVLRYKSPNTIIAIQSNVPGEHLYLSTRIQKEDKSYLTSMAKMVGDIGRTNTELKTRIAGGDRTAGHFGNGDVLEIPEVHFSGSKQHLNDLEGKFQVPGRVPPQQFETVSHRVEFDMDEKGVKIVGFGKGIGIGGVPPKPAHQRAFVFDEPFFVVAWRDDAPMPYFVAYVDGEKAFKKSSGYTGYSFLSLPPVFKSRCSAAERLNALKESGGTQEQGRMATRGWDYLKATQNPDGSWGDTSSFETTSLALLCYLARCETAESPFYGDTVTKAYLWMAEHLKKSPSEKRSLKETALATQAFGEMIVLSRIGEKRIPGLTEAFEACVKSVIDRQLPNGTWGAEDEEGYLITGHCIEAMLTARLTSLKIEGLPAALSRTRKYFLETAPPQNLSTDVTLLRSAIAVHACVSRSSFAEPAKSDIKSVVKQYRDLATAAKFSWSEASSLEHWLLFPAATRRYPDLTKALMQGAAQEITKAQEADGSVKSGPTMKPPLSLSAKDMELRRTILAILTSSLPYRWKVSPPREGSIFDRR